MPQLQDLPHRPPFRFVFDDVADDSVRVTLTPGGPWSRGGRFPDFFALEILSQATALLLTEQLSDGAVEARPGYLAGVTDFRLHRRLRNDDVLTLSTQLEGRFGSLIRVSASMSSGGTLVSEAKLLLGIGGFD